MQPTILVVVGVTGDLSKRKLLPAIEQIAKAKAAPEKFKVVGISRRKVSVEETIKDADLTDHSFLARHLSMYQMDLAEAGDYKKLKAYLQEIESEFGKKAQRLFYLSVPPQISEPIIRMLGESGLSKVPDTKLLLEKPFGVDLASAEDLIEQTTKHFEEAQIYRIDHYLAKEMAQNLVVFREGNALFKRTWNKEFIEKIEITASESLSIEGRVTFYEQTGALRDLVQSHLLQLAALTLMDLPKPDLLEDVPRLRRDALKQLHIPSDKSVNSYVKRGQYEGYRKEVDNLDSKVETFVQLELTSKDPRWTGVPIILTTGKSLKEKFTAVRITYKKDQQHESNELIITLQPDEGIKLAVWAKVPGYERRVERHSLSLAFKDHFPLLPDAYEQVLVDAIRSNHTLFTTSEEVLQTWRIIEPLQQAWGMSEDNEDLILYKPGTPVDKVV